MRTGTPKGVYLPFTLLLFYPFFLLVSQTFTTFAPHLSQNMYTIKRYNRAEEAQGTAKFPANFSSNCLVVPNNLLLSLSLSQATGVTSL
ncbi:hypothetical protein Prede_0518 [Prevotella dentalis DSM 3688]|uniref:Uncharacterized protein n=1 Tax=Prevotella dentalis (strain ATCC 49559 / DSM 3688 / JCM 13448 / NCTC 12043 / ES 2772) TaxID=908937 RepID=L0JC55_PREDD|nr:hypothetical protein Prede_0518 [Prevotella dentalis DSM 3688]